MTEVGGIAGDQLRAYIERIERLEEEKAALAADVREVFAEAKGNGFDVKIMRQVLRLRKMDGDDRAEEEALLDIYKRAIGMA
ncbi:MAG: DUF2312 domain-containing protein [Pseudomonadota bacterium]|jgi:uncharacterized protein (UPF0335 family)|nr:DUF2312 domain-containing protein [Alphaproteobacteria bacterium]MEC7514464.1 DUF2312 domain-containing protein [Pseudomonadota bacterium]MEC7571651.1 DUF2312 domain-containing protein [Pseudomonadota bacterium]MEC8027201.1 DUF2312 domain-containing protein [Pseudomonadota bacterium]MEC8054258.1 DUF2312 domain-containing protein [Pseudomonadota bacterium]|tara:strand:+ start:697 stop:942 length:246 start_codon:yes stop_codon:yes gene_type:complete